jgi:hypothetical protein
MRGSIFISKVKALYVGVSQALPSGPCLLCHASFSAENARDPDPKKR